MRWLFVLILPFLLSSPVHGQGANYPAQWYFSGYSNPYPVCVNVPSNLNPSVTPCIPLGTADVLLHQFNITANVSFSNITLPGTGFVFANSIVNPPSYYPTLPCSLLTNTGCTNTTNFWSQTQTFTLAPIFSNLTGYMFANGAGLTTASSTVPASVLTGTLPCGVLPALTGNVTTSGCAATVVNAPASGITGTTLASNVVTSSLTTIGTLVGGTVPTARLSGTLAAAQFPALTGDVTTSAGSLATTLATTQPAVHTWSLAQTFTVAPITSSLTGYLYGNAASAVTASTTIPSTAGTFLSSGTGAVSRTVFSKLSDWISTEDFGTVHDAVTNDCTPLQNALNYASANGLQTVLLGPYRYRLTSCTLSIPLAVSLVGKFAVDGQIPNAIYNGLPYSLVLDSASTINLGQSALLQGVVLITPNANGATPTTYANLRTIIANFAGTAITISGHDATARDIFCVGFTTCVSSTVAWQRTTLEDWKIDSTNGITLQNENDVARLKRVHIWPFATANFAFSTPSYAISAAANNGSNLIRVTVPANAVVTGDTVYVGTVVGFPGVQGRFDGVTVVDSTHIDLTGSAFAPSSAGLVLTSGSNQITVTSAKNFEAGQTLTCTSCATGIPGGTIITRVWPQANQIFMSANATASSSGGTLTGTNAAFTSANLYLNATHRTGIGIEFLNSGGGGAGYECVQCFVYGWDTGMHINNGQWDVLTDVAFDNFFPGDDISSIGLKIDGNSTGVIWNGGWVSSYGIPLFINGGTTGLAGNYNAHMMSNLTLNSSSNPSAAIIDMESGLAQFVGVTTNTLAPTNGNIFMGANVQGASFSGSDVPNFTVVPFNSTVAGVLNKDGASRIGGSLFGSPTFLSMTLGSTVSGQTLNGLTVQGTKATDQGGQIAMKNTNAGAVNINKYLRITDLGYWQLANSAYSAVLLSVTDGGHINPGSGTPALSACGTSPVFNQGNDAHGTFTEGTVATGCVLTFAVAYASTPDCTVTPLGATQAAVGLSYTVAAGAITVTNVSASNDKFTYQCMGN